MSFINRPTDIQFNVLLKKYPGTDKNTIAATAHILVATNKPFSEALINSTGTKPSDKVEGFQGIYASFYAMGTDENDTEIALYIGMFRCTCIFDIRNLLSAFESAHHAGWLTGNTATRKVFLEPIQS